MSNSKIYDKHVDEHQARMKSSITDNQQIFLVSKNQMGMSYIWINHVKVSLGHLLTEKISVSQGKQNR